MPTPNQDNQDSTQPIEDRLRQTLSQRAQQVSPSPKAFFTINQRINRREAASAWSPRNLWESRIKVRLQPSVVLSLVLLVALSVVTTLLIIRDDNTTQSVLTSAPISTNQTPAAEPEQTEGSLPADPPANDPASEPEAPLEPDGPVVIATDTSTPPSNNSPATTTETPPTTAEVQPTTTETPATTTEAPPETVPEPPPPTTPPTETLFEVYPLQVASTGYPIVYAEHRSDSEQLSRIPVRPDSEIDSYTATLNTAVDQDGVLWGEVLTPGGRPGWVQLKTVSIQPVVLTAEQAAEISQISGTLLEFVAAANRAGPDNSLLAASARNLQLSSRGMYIATVQEGAAVYEIYTIDMFVNSLLNDTSSDGLTSRLLALRNELSCLSQAQDVTGVSDSTPPAAMQVLSYTALNDSNGCEVLVYFDFLSEHPEIIGFSIHS